MKIYFAGSIRGGRENAEIYSELISYLKQFGEVLSEHVGDKSLEQGGEELSDSAIHERDLNWLLSSDVVVVEVTTPSLGVGYELGRAVENKKKILCLYREQNGKKLSGMIAGCPKVICKTYGDVQGAKDLIKAFLIS